MTAEAAVATVVVVVTVRENDSQWGGQRDSVVRSLSSAAADQRCRRNRTKGDRKKRKNRGMHDERRRV